MRKEKGNEVKQCVIYARSAIWNKVKLDEQTAKCMWYAQIRGLEICGIYKEGGAAMEKTLPVFQSLVAKMKAASIGIILVTDLSRISRNASVAKQTANELKRKHIKILCAGK